MGDRRNSGSPFHRTTNAAAYYVRQRSLEGYSFLHNKWWKKEKSFHPHLGLLLAGRKRGWDLWLLNNGRFGQHTDEGLGRDNGTTLCSLNQHHVKGVCSFDLWPHNVWFFALLLVHPLPPPHIQTHTLEILAIQKHSGGICQTKRPHRKHLVCCVEHCRSCDNMLQIWCVSSTCCLRKTQNKSYGEV